ncbi:uncharacterized protein LOC142334466 [Lycorma delicatula]|uniref:uncharacterized protein LOC142334466 n=1 Tax=Lycorma delicatula TaxID=130591 RepID=UPI003F5182BB
MEWSDDTVIELIREYKAHPVLWNPQHKYYKFNNRKLEAWTHIAEILNVDIAELKRKMASLLASYRRERQKAIKKSYGTGSTDDVSESTWFAYKAFSFLKEIYRPRLSTNLDQVTENGDIPEFDFCNVIKSEIQEPEELEILYSAPDSQENITEAEGTINIPSENELNDLRNQKRRLTAKRKYRNDDPRVPTLYKMVRRLTEGYDKRDECKAYGEYVMHKLRNYDFRTRSIVQHNINDIIFNADMGRYQQAVPGTSSEENNKSDVNLLISDIKSIVQDTNYSQEPSHIRSEGKHFLDA